MEKDTVTLNEEHGEILPRRKYTTSNRWSLACGASLPVATKLAMSFSVNEEKGEVLPRRKDKTPKAPWAAFGVRSVAAWRHLKTSSHDKCGEQYAPFLPSTSRPRRIGYNGEVAALESGLRKSRIAALLPREACFEVAFGVRSVIASGD